MHKIEDTLIVINSSNRADNLRTHKLLPTDLIKWVVAIPHDQATQYSSVLPKEHLYTLPKKVPQYLSSQRQHIMEKFCDEYKYIWLMDDDLTFFKRVDMKLVRCTEQDVRDMVQLVRHHLDEMPMVAVSTRLGNNRVEEDYAETTRVTRCYAMSTQAFKEVGATFAPFEPFLAQDFHMTLCFLNKGFNNRVLHTYAQEDIGSNAKGGCSSYRNQELHRKVSFWFAANHPEVTVKAKKSRNWNGYDGTRVDMIIAWKKAYRPRVKRKTGGLHARLKRKR